MNNHRLSIQGAVCPIPLQHDDQVLLGHGSGGKLSQNLIQKTFYPAFDNPYLLAGDDAGVIQLEIPGIGDTTKLKLAISTDSHVVAPLFFPGGDIGRLAICGTVNDVAMMGAQPLYLTAGFILEEGFAISDLEKILASMHYAAAEAGILVIAGDTKVVQKGKADGVYINTTGIGLIPANVDIHGSNARPGDLVILSGVIAEHGIAVLQARGELGFTSGIVSDVQPVNHLVSAMLAVSHQIHVLRDPTRGGLATTLNEIACQSEVGIMIHEQSIPIASAVMAACEMLGFDPLYIANEGKLVAIISAEDAQAVLSAMRLIPAGKDAVIIGEVIATPKGRVLGKTILGTTRVIDIPSGEILPRIC